MTGNSDAEGDASAADGDAPDRGQDELEDDAKQILDLPVDESTAEEVAGGAERSYHDYDYGDRSLG